MHRGDRRARFIAQQYGEAIGGEHGHGTSAGARNQPITLEDGAPPVQSRKRTLPEDLRPMDLPKVSHVLSPEARCEGRPGLRGLGPARRR